MSDVVVQPMGVPLGTPPAKIIPYYLVELEDKKVNKRFIAIKYDELAYCAKFVGFYYNGDTDAVATKYREIIEEMSVDNFVEIAFPWNRIVSIKSLNYKQKSKGNKNEQSK